ncbi:MAG: DUF1109 domain-containing protein [Burkholderiales bacterium]
MIATSELIKSLVAGATPVRRLRPPAARAALWLLFAGAIVALLAASHGLRPDLGVRLARWSFVTAIVASALTGVLAAVASFMLSLPDRSRLWILLPAPALAVWVSTIGYGCLTDWVEIGAGGLRLGEAVDCFATLVLISAPLSLAILVMLRHSALLDPARVAVMGGLAVSAIAATALSLFHSLDATVMVLMWNFGIAALMVGLASVLGKKMFSWVAPR